MPKTRVKIREGLLFDGTASSPAERIADKRHLKKAQILRLLRNQGPLSRVEIGRTLGFNLRTVSMLVDSLVAENLVLEQPGRTTASGRRPIPVALNPQAACVLGIDVGRTTTSLAILDLQGHLLARDDFPSQFTDDATEQANWLQDLIHKFLTSLDHAFPPLAGAGLSAEGLVHKSGKFHQLSAAAEPVRLHLEKYLQIPVIAGEDSQFLAMGEQWFGEARDCKHTAILNLTDGLGLGAIIDGKLMTGHKNWAGQIGHLPLGQPGIACFCGSSGCLENIASGSGLLRMSKAAGLKHKTPLQLAERAREGSVRDVELFHQFADSLATGLAIVIDLFNPELIVLSGPLASISDVFLPRLEERLDQTAIPYMRRETRLKVSALGTDAVLLGTCAAVFNRIYDTSQVNVDALL